MALAQENKSIYCHLGFKICIFLIFLKFTSHIYTFSTSRWWNLHKPTKYVIPTILTKFVSVIVIVIVNINNRNNSFEQKIKWK